MGSAGSDSDAEVIALAIKSALELGITDLQVTLGQVQFFEGLSRQLGLNDGDYREAQDCHSKQGFRHYREDRKGAGLSREDRDTLLMITECGGTYDLSIR